ncbi:hypothetical protein QTQ03_19025 [Micromonospora sp. WMMA1363]|uniref:hypothetical protein n=1 Tax=Micromonospora sp. WMMA1363 TaxID=3053985 RepID=UPI00259C8778|nr:hypothetical protein [Micromonospora sp. WMMA1363]MDM4721580.1 hypothetical protein [Micromonospora sp. WMMA1363]
MPRSWRWADGDLGALLPVIEAYQRVEAALADHPEEERGQLDQLPAARRTGCTRPDRLDPVVGRAAWAAPRPGRRRHVHRLKHGPHEGARVHRDRLGKS